MNEKEFEKKWCAKWVEGQEISIVVGELPQVWQWIEEYAKQVRIDELDKAMDIPLDQSQKYYRKRIKELNK